MLLSKLCFAVLLIDILLHSASGQFPAACTDNANNGIKVCCPLDCSGHGTCESITESADWSSIEGPGKEVVETAERVGEVFGTIDAAYQWPTEVFTNVCVCRDNYAGPDCSECDFGYEMVNGDCKVSSIRKRKNIMNMSVKERKDLIKVLNESKNEPPSNYAWAVIVEEADAATRSGLRLENVSTYDFFVYQHFFSKRDGDVKHINDTQKICNISDGDFSILDYGHKGPTFPTWHRYYLLIVERELGRIAERLGSPNGWNRYTFALPYWDWKVSVAMNTIFKPSYFGTFDFDTQSNRTPVEGDLFDGNNWPTVCDKHYVHLVNNRQGVDCSKIRSVCNPNEDRSKAGRLERGWFERGDFNHSQRHLPLENAIKDIICTKPRNTFMYDDVDMMNVSYGIESVNSSFRNRLEGFIQYNNSIRKFCDYGSRKTINNFHNAVHIYIYGHMKVVPSASNDPIFYLHHANVDRIFESWLQGPGYGTSYMPDQGNRSAHPGHNSEDYMVPFFPLKKNSDMYNRSTDFGYMYQDLDDLKCDENGASDAAFGQHPRSLLGSILGIILPIITAIIIMDGHHILEGLQV